MGRTLLEILMARDTFIFLLQHLGFVINLKKSALHPVEQMQFLGLVIETDKMTFALSEKKLKHVSPQSEEIFKQPKLQSLISQSCLGCCHQLSRPFYQLESSFDIFNRSKYQLYRKKDPTVVIWH